MRAFCIHFVRVTFVRRRCRPETMHIVKIATFDKVEAKSNGLLIQSPLHVQISCRLKKIKCVLHSYTAHNTKYNRFWYKKEKKNQIPTNLKHCALFAYYFVSGCDDEGGSGSLYLCVFNSSFRADFNFGSTIYIISDFRIQRAFSTRYIYLSNGGKLQSLFTTYTFYRHTASYFWYE